MEGLFFIFSSRVVVDVSSVFVLAFEAVSLYCRHDIGSHSGSSCCCCLLFVFSFVGADPFDLLVVEGFRGCVFLVGDSFVVVGGGRGGDDCEDGRVSVSWGVAMVRFCCATLCFCLTFAPCCGCEDAATGRKRGREVTVVEEGETAPGRMRCSEVFSRARGTEGGASPDVLVRSCPLLCIALNRL